MSEEEIELRDLVAQTLENNGVLSRIRVYKQQFLCYYAIMHWNFEMVLCNVKYYICLYEFFNTYLRRGT
jgi:hypothetical protein